VNQKKRSKRSDLVNALAVAAANVLVTVVVKIVVLKARKCVERRKHVASPRRHAHMVAKRVEKFAQWDSDKVASAQWDSDKVASAHSDSDKVAGTNRDSDKVASAHTHHMLQDPTDAPRPTAHADQTATAETTVDVVTVVAINPIPPTIMAVLTDAPKPTALVDQTATVEATVDAVTAAANNPLHATPNNPALASIMVVPTDVPRLIARVDQTATVVTIADVQTVALATS